MDLILMYVISMLLAVGQFFVAAGVCAGGYILLTKVLGWFAR